MATAVAMLHTVDPKQEIMEALGPYLADVQPLGTEVLLAVYIRPERTRGGLLLTENQGMRKEDLHQGKVCLVLAMGELAFSEDATHRWGGITPKVGDWVAINVGDTWAFELGNRRCRVVEDVDVRLILKQPDIVM
jgi:co-chaperonin GroES (HSP10)